MTATRRALTTSTMTTSTMTTPSRNGGSRWTTTGTADIAHELRHGAVDVWMCRHITVLVRSVQAVPAGVHLYNHAGGAACSCAADLEKENKLGERQWLAQIIYTNNQLSHCSFLLVSHPLSSHPQAKAMVDPTIIMLPPTPRGKT